MQQGWARWVLLGLAVAELAAALVSQGQAADSPTLVLNFLACVFLAACASKLLIGRPAALADWLLVCWLVVGGVRLAAAVVGAYPGWILHQSISDGNATIASETRTMHLDFRPGAAPAHLVNELPMQAGPDALQIEQHLSLVLEASTYVQGTGGLTIASAAPLRVLLDERPIFDSHLPPGTATGVIQTPTGPKSLDEIRSALQVAGYGGPWDDSSVALAYV